MNFMPDVYVQCEVCNGRRYNQETLAVKFHGHSIADILDLTIEDALQVLTDVPQVRQKLQTLVDVGLATCTWAKAPQHSPEARRSA